MIRHPTTSDQRLKTNFKLYFDSSDRNKIAVKLFKNGKLISEKAKKQLFTSQVLLPLIAEICSENKITPHQLSEIEINPGPGSYTGLKVGAAVANALGWYLKIPVNGEKNKIVNPVYK